MFTKKLSDQFSKGLLDEVKKVMKKKEKESSEKEMKGPESSCEEYSAVKAAGDTRQIQARIHGAKTSGALKNKPTVQYKKDGTLYKEGVVPTSDQPTDKDRQTASKVAALLAKEKKPAPKVTEGSDLPWKEDPKNPSHKVGVHKDEYGNTIKNVAKHLAKKAMKANEETINEGGWEDEDEKDLANHHAYQSFKHDDLSKKYAEQGDKKKALYHKAQAKKHLEMHHMYTEEIDAGLEDELKAQRQTKKSVEDAKKKYGVKKEETVKSGNLTYGYHGSVEASSDADRAKKYSAMHTKVKKLVGSKGHLEDAKKPNIMVKHFLDSAHGRHIAGEPTDTNIVKRFAHFKKTYDASMHEEVQVDEVAPPGAKYERMIKHIKKGYAKDGKLTDKEKSIAYATAWKAKNEAVGDVTVKKLSSADAFKKNTGQDVKKTSVSTDPKSGKTLYQKVTSEEAEQVDEALDSMSDAKIKYHATKNFPHGKYSSKEIKAEHERRMKSTPNYHAVKASLGEEAEQIDEISAKTKSSYAAKASEYIMNKAHSMKPDEVKKWNRRQKGMQMLKKEEVEQIEETFLTPNAHAELKNMPKDAVKRHHDVYMATANSFKKNGSHALAAAAEGAAREIKRKYMSEESEQIDELSKDTMLKYLHANKKSAAGGMGDKEALKRMRGTDLAVRKYTARNNKYVRVPATEEFEQDALNLSNEEFEAKWLTPQVSEIDEAFEALSEGRPKVMIQHPWDKNRKLHPVKDKDLISKLRAKGYTNLGDRPSTENPINQLRKASTSMTGGHHVTLHTGEKHHVTNAQASRILEKHASMKTAKEKLDYQDKLREKEFLQKEAGK